MAYLDENLDNAHAAGDTEASRGREAEPAVARGHPTGNRRQAVTSAVTSHDVGPGRPTMTKQERQAEAASRFYHIGDVATLTGLSADDLRAWERVDLLAPRRTAGRVRQYTEDDVARVRLIARTLQHGGFSRRAIAALLQSGDLRPDAADYAPGPAPVRRSRAGAGGVTRQSSAFDARPPDEARSEHRTLDAVARINDALASGRPVTEVLQVICHETCGTFGVSDAVVWLAEPHPLRLGRLSARQERAAQTAATKRALVAAAAHGPHSAAATSSAVQLSVPLDDRRAPEVRAFHERRGLVVDRLETSPLAHPGLLKALPGVALLVVPLLAAGGEPVGVLSLRDALDPERFDVDDLERVRLFAVQAALAIETARLHAEIRAAREDVEDQRALWQAAVDDLPALVCTCDRLLRITYASPTCRRVLGWPSDPPGPHDPREPLGLPDEWTTDHGFFWARDWRGGGHGDRRGDRQGNPAWDPAFVPLDALPLPRALREDQAVHDVEVAHRLPDGSVRLIAWDAAPLRSSQGEVVGAVAVGRDVTEVRRRREREASLAAVARAAAGAPDPDGAEGRAARVLSALVEHIHTPGIAAALYLLDAEADILRRVGSLGMERSGTHAPVIPISRQHPWWQLLVAGPAYSAHDHSWPRWLRSLSAGVRQSSTTRAWATVPLRAGDALVGVLSVGLSAPHVWDAPERAWIEACAATIAGAVENDRLFAAERRRARELEAALDADKALRAPAAGVTGRPDIKAALPAPRPGVDA